MEICCVAQQTETWDCGIARLLMVLSCLQKLGGVSKAQMLETVGKTQSIWSMNLVRTLQEYRSSSFSYLFCSKALHVDRQHQHLSFYCNKAFDADCDRVTNLFQRAQEEGWNLL